MAEPHDTRTAAIAIGVMVASSSSPTDLLGTVTSQAGALCTVTKTDGYTFRVLVDKLVPYQLQDGAPAGSTTQHDPAAEAQAHAMADLEEGCSVTAGSLDTEKFYGTVAQHVTDTEAEEHMREIVRSRPGDYLVDTQVSHAEIGALCSLVMASYPSPISEDATNLVQGMANTMAQDAGLQDWIEAFHVLTWNTRSPEQTTVPASVLPQDEMTHSEWAATPAGKNFLEARTTPITDAEVHERLVIHHKGKWAVLARINGTNAQVIRVADSEAKANDLAAWHNSQIKRLGLVPSATRVISFDDWFLLPEAQQRALVHAADLATFGLADDEAPEQADGADVPTPDARVQQQMDNVAAFHALTVADMPQEVQRMLDIYFHSRPGTAALVMGPTGRDSAVFLKPGGEDVMHMVTELHCSVQAGQINQAQIVLAAPIVLASVLQPDVLLDMEEQLHVLEQDVETEGPLRDALAAITAAIETAKLLLMQRGHSGIGHIEAERHEQRVAHGYGPDHDQQHTDGSMVEAAQHVLASITGHGHVEWPWQNHGHNPVGKDKGLLHDLRVAGALIAAEIDRILVADPEELAKESVME